MLSRSPPAIGRPLPLRHHRATRATNSTKCVSAPIESSSSVRKESRPSSLIRWCIDHHCSAEGFSEGVALPNPDSKAWQGGGRTPDRGAQSACSPGPECHEDGGLPPAHACGESRQV